MIQRVLNEEVNAQAVRLELLIDLLDRMVAEALEQQDGSVRLTLLFASVLKTRQAGRAVLVLSKEGFVEEILSISRTLIEGTVNAAYLQYAGERELERYVQFHPEAQSQRGGMVRRSKAHGLASGLIQRLGELVLRNGMSPKDPDGSNWTMKSLMDRAQLTDAASNIPIMVGLVERCYSRGHAAMHGTVGSLKSFVAALERGRLPSREDRLSPLSQAFFGVNFGIVTLCIFLNSYFQLGMEEAIEEATTADSQTKPSLQGE
jgi:hypothetical protein